MQNRKNKIPPEISKLSFEDSLIALEEIVRQLEGGRIKLEDAVSAYEKGVFLKNHCEEKLKEAKMRIEKITISEDGEVAEIEAFNNNEEETDLF